VDAWINQGIALHDLKRYDEALASYERALVLKPDYVEAWSNRGNTLNLLKRYDEALASFERALTLEPNYVKALLNYGDVLHDLKRYDEALASFERALVFKPDHAESAHNKALNLLSFEQFKQGWELYQWRWKVKTFSPSYIQTNIPPWSENRELKKLLVWAEQGIGDEIIYTSILANFTPPGIEVTLISDERLHPLLARSLPHIKLLDRKVLKSFIEKNTFDAHIPIGDLGRLLSIDKNKLQLNAKPYLKPNLKRQEEYDHYFSDLKPSIICGIAWRSKNEAVGSDKSLSLLKLAPLFNLKNIKFVNLQYGDVSKEVEDVQMALGTTIHINPNLDATNDIDGLVSQINMCDMVVTTSNVTAHLAGAVGKKGVVLLPYSRGKLWYWHDGQGSSLWYPSLHLISQNKIDDWSECIDGATRWVKENM
jgi:tetratricopeptide (TPR) repeat protein